VVLVVGPNGAGKTNLLESLHVGTQGFSPRTRNDMQLLRFGADAGRIALRGTRSGGVPVELEVTLRAGTAKQGSVNGAPLRATELLRAEVSTLVFTPDRLAVVKGAPAVRRAYLDRALGRLLPARAGVPPAYASALAQRNAGLRRIALGHSSRDALEPWTERLAALAAELVSGRREALSLLAPAFAERAGELGLADALLHYEGRPPEPEELHARLERDLERGATGLGPHLDDVTVSAGRRELRQYGSQGEQRLAVLALLLAEFEVLAERSGQPPLLLLDDVLSELDPGRRRALSLRIAGRGQTLVTATTASALPSSPDQLLEVTPGEVRVA
jgi:DNA replication and repair protein RecF